MLGLNKEQQDQIQTMMAAVTVLQQYNVAELEQQLGLESGTIANRLNVASTSMVTEEILKAAVANGVLTNEQLKAILSTNKQTTSNLTGAASFETLGASAKAAGAAMLSTPMGWITTLLALLPLAITGVSKLYDWLVVTAEEAYEEAEGYRQSYEEINNEIKDLDAQLSTSKERLEELYRLSDNGTITLIEQEELERLEQTNAELETTIARKKELAALDAREANQEYVESYNKTTFTSNSQHLLTTEMDTIYEQNSDLLKKYDSMLNGITVEWEDGEYEKASQLKNRLFEISDMLDALKWSGGSVDYAAHVQELIDSYNELNQLQESGVTLSSAQKDLLESTRNELVGLADTLDADYLSQYVGEDENTAEWKGLLDTINKTIYAAEYFNEKLTELPDYCYKKLEGMGANAKLTAEEVENLANQFPTLQAWMDESGYTAEDVAKHFNALSVAEKESGSATGTYSDKLSALTDVLSNLQAAYDALDSADADMATGDGISPDTIKKLADAEENYLDYLYEENGVVKLNTDAWRENAEAKTRNNIADIQMQNSDLERQNRSLEEQEDWFRRQISSGVAVDSPILQQWKNELQEVERQIESNNKVISNGVTQIEIYQATLNSFDADRAAISGLADAFKELSGLQDDLANGMSISSEKAMELVAVYPELLASATASADGQIQLDQAVVSAFIQGRRDELNAAIDVEIQKLEAKKSTLQAQLDCIDSVLEASETGDNAAVESAKDSATQQMLTYEAVLAAAKQCGLDEVTAEQLALAAMSGDMGAFRDLASTAFSDVDINSADSMTSMMTNFANTANNIIGNANKITQAFNTMAAAIRNSKNGLQTGLYGGVASSGSVSGKEVKKGDALDSLFEGLKSHIDNGDDGGSALENKFNEILNSYQNDGKVIENARKDLAAQKAKIESQIQAINGQIASLQALKAIPLGSGGGSSGGGGGSGGSGGGSSKEIEEYIADIDDYRDAIERLRKAQQYTSDTKQNLEDTEDLKQRILLERQLIGAYSKEQDALHNLNNQRDSTITAGVKALKELGFAVKYNADTNEFWIENLEHLNELQADSVGEYGSIQEATNALRKDTEGLIDSLTDLNEQNREGSQNWRDLKGSIQEANDEILQLLDDIVDQASDAVDSIQDVYDTLHDAADEYAESGYVTIDTLQGIIDLGLKYVTYLMDENGQLVINEERIRDIIAAKTQQLAIESALSYVEALRIAKQAGDIETLNDLLYATQDTTDATWGLVYANLALAGLDDEQLQAAYNNINAIRALGESAVHSIGKTAGSVTDELNGMKDGLDDILKYVMDMIKQQIEDQIDVLEDMKDAYSEIINKKKESLEASKDEADYQKSMSKKLREIAKLQARIDALSLDNSRDAQAERSKLLEEMAELQEDLAESQADKSLEATEKALEDMETAYHQEKDDEIDLLEDTISSYQKLYDKAIDYIQNNWNTLYSDLIAYNTQYGDVLNSEITTAWENCYAAAKKYGDYVTALNNIGSDIDSAGSNGKTPNTVVGETNYENSSTNEEMIHAIIKKMYANSQSYSSANNAQRKARHQENVDLAARLSQYGIKAVYGSNGGWYVDRVGGELLYEKYKKYIYHKGGIAGDQATLKDNEILAKLEKGEPVLTAQMWENLTAMFERMDRLSASMSDLPGYIGQAALNDTLNRISGGTVNNVNTSNQPVRITIGDTIIDGNASPETVKQHAKVTYDMVEQISRILKIKL